MEATDYSTIQRNVIVVGVDADDTIWVQWFSSQERVCQKGIRKREQTFMLKEGTITTATHVKGFKVCLFDNKLLPASIGHCWKTIGQNFFGWDAHSFSTSSIAKSTRPLRTGMDFRTSPAIRSAITSLYASLGSCALFANNALLDPFVPSIA